MMSLRNHDLDEERKIGYRRLFIMRKDLHMSSGKLASQVAHCAEAYWLHIISSWETGRLCRRMKTDTRLRGSGSGRSLMTLHMKYQGGTICINDECAEYYHITR